MPGLDIETAQLMEDLIGDLTAVPQPVEIELFGNDPAALHDAAERTAAAIGKIKGVVEVVDGLRVAGDSITISINRPAAALEGLDADAISKQLGAEIDGSVVTRIQQGETSAGVRLWTPPALRAAAWNPSAPCGFRRFDGHDLAAVARRHRLHHAWRRADHPPGPAALPGRHRAA